MFILFLLFRKRSGALSMLNESGRKLWKSGEKAEAQVEQRAAVREEKQAVGNSPPTKLPIQFGAEGSGAEGGTLVEFFSQQG